jgi:hypothetical protein
LPPLASRQPGLGDRRMAGIGRMKAVRGRFGSKSAGANAPV